MHQYKQNTIMRSLVYVLLAFAFMSIFDAVSSCPAINNTDPVSPNEEEVDINNIHVFTREYLMVSMDVDLTYTAPQHLDNVGNTTNFVKALAKEAIKRNVVGYSIDLYRTVPGFVASSLCSFVFTKLGDRQITLERFQLDIHMDLR